MITNNLNINDRNSSTNYNKPPSIYMMVYIVALAIFAIALAIIPFKPIVAGVIIGSTVVISLALHLFFREIDKEVEKIVDRRLLGRA